MRTSLLVSQARCIAELGLDISRQREAGEERNGDEEGLFGAVVLLAGLAVAWLVLGRWWWDGRLRVPVVVVAAGAVLVSRWDDMMFLK
jgi:hypothetical protein